MTDFKPTRPPRGRLVRLGVVLDTRNTSSRLSEIARMCDWAGIDALWAHDQPAPGDEEQLLDGWAALALASQVTNRPRIGAKLDPARRGAGEVAAMAGALDAGIGGRLELEFSARWVGRGDASFDIDDPDMTKQTDRLERYVGLLRRLLTVDDVDPGDSERGAGRGAAQAASQPGGPPISVEAVTPCELAVAARVADDVVLPAAAAVPDLTALAERIRSACEAEGRDPRSLGVGLEVPVSIGRTFTEAAARAESEPLFRITGSPREVGIFGTLERCQERVIELAHAGVTDLRCVMPNSSDVQDVIAQLTAISIGTTDVLAPGAPKSRAPDPPKTWGGRRGDAPSEPERKGTV